MSDHPQRSSSVRWLAVACLGAACFNTFGCGGDSGPRRYQVSGTVTFNGGPVPTGTVTFEPDVAQGNRGPAGYADIVNGRYTTHRGAVGGPHVVKILGAKATTVETEDTELFPAYRTTHDLPRKNCVVDFEVPASASRRRRPSGRLPVPVRVRPSGKVCP